MIKIKNPADCCGCTSCASVCAHDAIIMKPDALGFLYPEVDKAKCVDCGLCDKVCAFNDDYDKSLNLSRPKAFAARHKDMHEVETSRSGAAFIAISDYILETGGIVYGVGFADHFRVVHKRATTKEERNEFKGSKYVQSDVNTVFRQIKTDLRAGMKVLFSGTPCQTSGLNSFVGKKLRENLYLVDIVCHGVPSPFIWRDYISYLEKKQGSTIEWVNFRDKQKFGWSSHNETFKFKNGEDKVCFTFQFYKDLFFRKSCAKCHFANIKRPSDITIADYWGLEKVDPNFNTDNKGCSLIFLNTEKGCGLFDFVKDRMNIVPTSLDKCMQPNLRKPTRMHPNRYELEKDYIRHGFSYVFSKNYDSGLRYSVMLYYKKSILKICNLKGRFKRTVKRIFKQFKLYN